MNLNYMSRLLQVNTENHEHTLTKILIKPSVTELLNRHTHAKWETKWRVKKTEQCKNLS